jgi:hypothetical protein
MRDILVPNDMGEYTSFPVDVFAVKQRHASVLKVTGAGTITVKMTGSAGAQRVLNVTDGETIFGQFISIDAVSGPTRVRVGWN